LAATKPGGYHRRCKGSDGGLSCRGALSMHEGRGEKRYLGQEVAYRKWYGITQPDSAHLGAVAVSM
jgi:hypothetical protein